MIPILILALSAVIASVTTIVSVIVFNDSEDDKDTTSQEPFSDSTVIDGGFDS